ncbi:hypothetical protein CROQUDRAFT_653078 [Cronartium quercuum f. sp. fusiforme G11]|uniref:Uncharacterized protein n=1 Tax=Cronartium quercuum f. sp. fusiforme G11 TaxID=708437 RepID=A0A9P6NPG2_9BASI|nr:hypothetical protein CROQUDRAFT_653078 [Cronartium quercuum f. sp. fusiforme G11]
MLSRNPPSPSSSESANSNQITTSDLNGARPKREDTFSVTYDHCLGISLIGAQPISRAQANPNHKRNSTSASVSSQSSGENSHVIDIASTPKRSSLLKWGRPKAIASSSQV